jgi:hypothetical protein
MKKPELPIEYMGGSRKRVRKMNIITSLAVAQTGRPGIGWKPTP